MKASTVFLVVFSPTTITLQMVYILLFYTEMKIWYAPLDNNGVVLIGAVWLLLMHIHWIKVFESWIHWRTDAPVWVNGIGSIARMNERHWLSG